MEINRLHILTDEQLVKMAQEGSETAGEILINKYKEMVRIRSKYYYIVGADNEDVVQEGMIGLFKAITSYDDEKNASFKTFAETCINAQIINAINKANRKKHQPLNESVSLYKEVEMDENDITLSDIIKDSKENNPESLLILREVIEALKVYDSGIFSDLEWQVWNEKLKGKDYKQIAESLGRSPKTIDNATQRIRKKIVAYLEK